MPFQKYPSPPIFVRRWIIKAIILEYSVMVNFEQKDWKLYSGEQVRQYVPLRSTDSHLNGGKKHFEMHCTDRYGYKDHLFSEEREKNLWKFIQQTSEPNGHHTAQFDLVSYLPRLNYISNLEMIISATMFGKVLISKSCLKAEK